MDSWDDQEFHNHPNDTLEFQNTQNQLFGCDWIPSASSMKNPLFNFLELHHDSAKTSSMNLPHAYIGENTLTIVVPEERGQDLKPFQCSATTEPGPLCYQYENAAPLSIMNTLEVSQPETQPEVESASTEIVLTAGVPYAVVQEVESLSSPESQPQIVFSPEMSEKSLEKRAEKESPNGSEYSRRRAKRKFVPVEAKDDDYWKKRAKNNEAARRSRATAKEKKRKLHLENMKSRNTDLKSRYLSLCIEQEKLKCDAILLGIDLAKL